MNQIIETLKNELLPALINGAKDILLIPCVQWLLLGLVIYLIAKVLVGKIGLIIYKANIPIV